MATKEEISMVGFEIVAYAGDAQTDLLAALDAAREGDFEKAEQLHKDASDALIGAHDTQTKLLSQEAGGGEMEMTFIMAHAQDTLMTTMILEKQARFTIDAYKRIAELEAKLAQRALTTKPPSKSPAATRDRAFSVLLPATHPEIVIGDSLGALRSSSVRFLLGGYTSFRIKRRTEEVSKCRTMDRFKKETRTRWLMGVLSR